MSRTSAGDTFAQRVSAAVRGSAALREDIADEIADHLCCHTEEHPTEAADAAIQAFGDPKIVARELRRVHLGGQIMFQRIMVAVLIVIVIALGANAWFSWRAARQQSQQFTEMNERLGSLVDLQQRAAQSAVAGKSEEAPRTQPTGPPPKVKAFFFTGPPEEPVTNYTVHVESFPNPRTRTATQKLELVTDSNGEVNLTGRVQAGDNYRLTGKFVPAVGKADPAPGSWSRVIRVNESDDGQQIRMNVGPRDQYRVLMSLSPEVTWDKEKMRRATVQFVQSFNAIDRTDSTSSEYTLDLWKENTITGLLPGPAKALMRFIIEPEDISIEPLPPLPLSGNPSPRTASPGTPQPQRPSLSPGLVPTDDQVYGITYETPEFVIPEDGGQITLEIVPDRASQITGVIFDGTPDKPVAGRKVSLLYWDDNQPSPPYFEFLSTDARGNFASLPSTRFSRSGGVWVAAFEWKTEDSDPIEVRWPLNKDYADQYEINDGGTRFQLDVARLGTVRLNITGMESLLEGNRRLLSPLRIGPVTMRIPRGVEPSRRGPSVAYASSGYLRCWDLAIERSTNPSAIFLLPQAPYSIRANLLLAEWKDSVPDLEQHLRYSRQFEFELLAGKSVEVTIPADELDKWIRDRSEWHERGEGNPSTAPAARAAAAK